MADDIAASIREARSAGYQDRDIAEFVGRQDPRVREAFGQGYTATEILDILAPQRTAGETVTRTAALAARGAIPSTALGATGAAVGAPFGPVGAATGYAVGSLAIPGADALVSAYNALVGPEEQVQLPSAAISKVLDRLGMVRPETRGERMVEAAGGALGPTVGQIAAGRVAAEAGTPTQQAVGRTVSQAPVAQMAAAPTSAATSQLVGEVTGSPLASTLAALATAAPFGVRTTGREVGPSAADLRAQASRAYQRSAAAGAVIDPTSLENAGQRIISNINKEIVIDPEVDTGAMAVQRRLAKTFDQPQTLEQLDLTRQFIRDETKTGGRSAKYAREALKQFDDYIENLSAKDIIAGNSKTAIAELKNARDLWKRSNKTAVLEEMFNSAELRKVNMTQSGFENALRRQLINLADSEDLKFFSQAEQKAITDAAKGGNLQNFLRRVGQLSPTGVVSTLSSGGLGYLLGGPQGAAAIMGTGAASRLAANQLAAKEFRNLQSMIALGREPQVTRAPFAAVQPVTLRGLLSTQTE
jgi:hypothetical protein